MQPVKATKPAKPYASFPLFPHQNGQWAAKIKGRTHYFGTWDNPQVALNRFLEERDYYQAGRTPPSQTETIADLLDTFLGMKNRERDAGEITKTTYAEYETTCDVIADFFGTRKPLEGIAHQDLSECRAVLGIGKSDQHYSACTHKKRLTIARMIFRLANEDLGQSIRYREALKPPSAKLLRKVRNARGERLFTAKQVRTLIDRADPKMRAMIYLGINCAFGPDDCSRFPTAAVDLDTGWHTFPRPKTEVARRCPLWPETVEALRKVAQSPLVFGNGWNRHKVNRRWKKVAEGTTKLGFYTLKNTFETISTDAPVNQAVIDRIAGHAPKSNDMGAIYRQRVFDKSLRRCTDYVRDWLLGTILLE